MSSCNNLINFLKNIMKRILFFVFILIPAVALAIDDCPFGETDCAYPGECGAYVDVDNNGICDHSQEELEAISNVSVDTAEDEEKTGERKRYPLILATIITLIGYYFTYFLFKIGKITRLTHRKIWNSILALSFAISALLGILLVLRINFGTIMILPFNVLYWHVVLGIVMTIITIFHITWHWAYFKNIFKRPK